MEFHIAHEQVIQGRKKYLIPILLTNVKTDKIKDPDLRMYVESHTYLDSRDKVMIFTENYDLSHCGTESFFSRSKIFKICISMVQANLKKRLHYAMPRIPLRKLKANKNGKHEIHNVPDKPESHVGTIAKRILNAKMGKGKAIDKNITVKNMIGTDVAAQNENTDKIRRKHPEYNEGKKLHKIMKMAEKMHHMGDLVLTRIEKRQLTKIYFRLEKLTKETHLDTSATESDTSETTPDSCSHSSSQPEAEEYLSSVAVDKLSEVDGRLDMHTTVDEDCGEDQYEGAMGGVFQDVEDSSCEIDAEKNFVVIADVHFCRGEDEIEGAVGGVVEEPLDRTSSRNSFLSEETGKHNAVMVGCQIDSDSSIEFDHPKQSKRWIRWRKGKHNENILKLVNVIKKTVPQGEEGFQWGQEESSNSDGYSDGGWDFETDGKPLLPRQIHDL